MPRHVLMFAPTAGLLLGATLMTLATARYPGGYRWAEQTVSALLAPTVAQGDHNPARPMAVGGAFVMLASAAVVFLLVSARADTAFHRTTIRVGGIGAMVYAALTVTPMHDLMVDIALAFFLAAMFATLHLLLRRRRFWLFAAGVAGLAIKLASAAIYYGDCYVEALPVAQKLSLAWTAGWLVLVQFADRSAPSTVGPEARHRTTP